MHRILCVEIGEMEACPPCCNALVAVIIPGMLLAFWWCERGRCKHQLSLTFWFITHGLRRTQYMFMWAYYCLYWFLHYKFFSFLYLEHCFVLFLLCQKWLNSNHQSQYVTFAVTWRYKVAKWGTHEVLQQSQVPLLVILIQLDLNPSYI